MELIDLQDKWERLVDKRYTRGYTTLTENERVWLNVQTLIQDAENGGLISHYYNSGADTIDDTIKDLAKLNADDIVLLINKINSLFPNSNVPKDIHERNQIISSLHTHTIDDLLTDLDNAFFSKQQILEQKLIEFIKLNGLD